ncbi:MAG: tetratricopeptide repeat protein, partial [Planctomycetota bacterium]
MANRILGDQRRHFQRNDACGSNLAPPLVAVPLEMAPQATALHAKAQDVSARQVTGPRLGQWAMLAFVSCVTTLGGCQTLAGTPTGLDDIFGRPEVGSSDEGSDSRDGVVQAGGMTSWQNVQKQSNKVVNFVTGREQENQSRAKDLYRQGDAEFRRASTLETAEARAVFVDAAKLFQKSAEASPGSALEQDALMMQGESLFFADRLPDAVDTFQRLQKDHPRNRHNDRVAARLFSISRYWIDLAKADEDDWIPLNLFDKKRPATDPDGHAVRVLDQIRFDDPTGRLADDATMAAAAEYIRQGKFEDADEFLTDLRESFPDSEHLFLAHLLGIRCKLEVYAGPNYSASALDAAAKLVKQTRQRFPDKMQDQDNADLVARAAAEIAYLKAEKLFERAEYRDKQKRFGSAASYYQNILNNYGDTPFADQARARMAAIADKPAVPAKRMAWLQSLLP